MNINIKKNKFLLSIFFGILVIVLIFFPNFYTINKNIQKNIFNYSSYINKEIVVVKIDSNTTKKLWNFPFDRKLYSKLIENLNKAWASVIWFDIIFADKTNSLSDKNFADAIKKAWNIVLWWATKEEWSINWVFEKPLEILETNNPSWYFDIIVDPAIWNVFSVLLSKKFFNWEFEYFWISILRKYFSIIYKDNSYLQNKLSFLKNEIKLDNIKLQNSWNNPHELIINYEKLPFNSYSFFEIYDDYIFSWLQKEYWEDFLKNKIILVWATLKWIDIQKTSQNNEEYWVNIHASFLNSVLNNNFSKYFNKNFEFLLIFIFSILAIFINLNKWVKNLILSNVLVLFLIIVYFISIKNFKLILNYPFELFLAIILSAVFSNILKYLFENKDKLKLNKALSEYVSKDVAEEILSWKWSINLEWEKKRVITFFSDIEGFTSISERFEPEDLISYLKDYLTEMSEIIINNKWFVNKYEWDAILALWWVFWKTDESIAKLACDSSLKQLKRLDELNEIWQNDPRIWKIKIRIWLNIGDAILWNIWAKWKKLEFTAIWDSVNLASRLEEINKYYGTTFCVSENIYNETKDFYEFRYIDKIRVIWKEKSVDIYELIDFKWQISNEESKFIKDFENAVMLYQNEKFKESYKEFEKMDSKRKDIKLYKDRCLYYMQVPPPKDWDKVWTMTQK